MRLVRPYSDDAVSGDRDRRGRTVHDEVGLSGIALRHVRCGVLSSPGFLESDVEAGNAVQERASSLADRHYRLAGGQENPQLLRAMVSEVVAEELLQTSRSVERMLALPGTRIVADYDEVCPSNGALSPDVLVEVQAFVN
jgi:hypothetical protein